MNSPVVGPHVYAHVVDTPRRRVALEVLALVRGPSRHAPPRVRAELAPAGRLVVEALVADADEVVRVE